MTQPVAFPLTSVTRLRAALHGQLLTPESQDYDAVRVVWNGMIDRRPAVIVRCADIHDVVAAVTFGREHGGPVSVRGGGHNVAGLALCDGGLLIDMSPMRSIRVN